VGLRSRFSNKSAGFSPGQSAMTRPPLSAPPTSKIPRRYNCFLIVGLPRRIGRSMTASRPASISSVGGKREHHAALSSSAFHAGPQFVPPPGAVIVPRSGRCVFEIAVPSLLHDTAVRAAHIGAAAAPRLGRSIGYIDYG